jgi:hypothetical protein
MHASYSSKSRSGDDLEAHCYTPDDFLYGSSGKAADIASLIALALNQLIPSNFEARTNKMVDKETPN